MMPEAETKNPTEPAPVETVVDIGETRIACLHYESAGPPLVLLHATGFNPWLWHPVARQLAGTYNIFCPYFCDHRGSDPYDGGLSWALLAGDLAEFCRVLDLSAPLLAGHSMGGAVMVIAAGEFGLAPARMLLIEPILLPRQFYGLELRVEDHPLAGKSIKRRNGWQDVQEARTYLKSKELFRRWDEEVLDLYVTHGLRGDGSGGLELACHPKREAALFMGGLRRDPWPLLREVSSPTLVLEGELTENKGLIDFRAAAAAMPFGIWQEVPGTGHLIPMEAPRETARLMHGFFM